MTSEPTTEPAFGSESDNLVDQLRQQVESGRRENRKLYKLVNRYKQQITALEIEVAGHEVTIEDLGGRASHKA